MGPHARNKLQHVRDAASHNLHAMFLHSRTWLCSNCGKAIIGYAVCWCDSVGVKVLSTCMRVVVLLLAFFTSREKCLMSTQKAFYFFSSFG